MILLLILLVVFISYFQYWLLIISSPLLWVYCYLHRKKSLKNPQGEISEKCSKYDKKSYRRHFIYFVDGYYRWMIKTTGNIPSHHIRNFFYKYVFLVSMGKNSIIYHGCEIRGSWLLSLDEGATIGDNAILDARRGGIYIGKHVNIGSNVSLWTGGHNTNDPWFRSQPCNRGPIFIGNRAWIGPNATILHSVSIGNGAVIAAGAVVTKNIPEYALCGGIPAKKIAERNRDLKYEFDGSHLHFL